VTQLVLPLFPGIGLLDMAFEEEGLCVVRGPDLLWGGDIRTFHPPAGVFWGVIGGPPCQAFSRLSHLVRSLYGDAAVKPNLIPEYERVVLEARPDWFLMENVPDAPIPCVDGYRTVARLTRDDATGGCTSRTRRFTFGWNRPGIPSFGVRELALYTPEPEPTVCATAGGRRVSIAIGGSGKPKPGTRRGGALPHETTRPIGVMCELQGLPPAFLDHSPLTLAGKRSMIGNGVPLPMGRAVARAVKRALGIEVAA
jgi:DNA (cytosine-5)-methyltransferase 1